MFLSMGVRQMSLFCLSFMPNTVTEKSGQAVPPYGTGELHPSTPATG